MSLIELYPTKWAVNETWNKIKIYGIMQNNKSIFAEIPFLPYLIVDYESLITPSISEIHNILINDSRAFEIKNIHKQVFQINCLNKEDYEHTRSDFIRIVGKDPIVGDNTSMLTKYFIFSNINPGSWKTLNRIQNNYDKINTNTSFTNCDHEFHAHELTDSNNTSRPIPKYAFFNIATVSCNKFTSETDEIVAISLNIGVNSYLIKIGPLLSSLPGIIIYNLTTEKELCETFFKLLLEHGPVDYLITYGKSVVATLGTKCQIHRVKMANFSKEKGKSCVFKNNMMIIPGITFIDLQLYIAKILPHCSDINLKDATLRFLDLESGDYTLQGLIKNSMFIQQLWEKLDVLQNISRFVNFWKNDAETILAESNKKLFKNLSLYFGFNRKQKYNIGNFTPIKVKNGIYHNVYVYSLSKIYTKLLETVNVPPELSTFAINTFKYFKDTNMSEGAFKSKLLPVNFSFVEDNINRLIQKLDSATLLWMDKDTVAIATSGARTAEGPLKLSLLDFYKSIILLNTGQIRIDAVGHKTQVGISILTNPPFPLMQKFIDLLIANIITLTGSTRTSITNISLPEITPTLEDLVLTMKLTFYDYESDRINSMDSVKKMIIAQMLEAGIETNCRWQPIKFIMTMNGPVIEKFYISNPVFYLNKINIQYYKQQLLLFKQNLI